MIWCWLSKEQKEITRVLLSFPSLLIPATNYNFKNRGPHTPDVRSRYEIVGKCILFDFNPFWWHVSQLGTAESLRSSKKMLPSESLSTFVVSWKTSHFYPLLILFNFQQCLSNCCPIFRPSQEWERTQFSRKETTLSAETLKPTLSPFRWYTGWLCNPPPLQNEVQKIELG